MRTAIAVLVLICAVTHAPACRAGTYHNLRTVPPSPNAGQPFLVVFENGICEDIFLDPPGLAPTVTLEGSVLSVAVDYIGVFSCNAPVTTHSVPVRGLLAGDYSLDLIIRELQSPESYGHVQTVALTVGPALPRTPWQIPAVDGAVLGLLAASMLGAALWIRRGHRPR